MSKPLNLKGAVVAITGGARGIGLATAKALTAAGARVSIGDVDLELAQQSAKQHGLHAARLDVRDPASFAEFIASTEAALGPLDVLVNNAGIMPMGAFLEEAPGLSDAQIDINFRGVIHGMRAALPGMLARGRGHMINVASLAGRFAIPGAAIYCGTKFAVVGMTEAVAGEYRDSGVNFTVIMPSAVSTELASGTDAAAKGMLPVVSPEDVANAIVSAIRAPRLMVAVPDYLNKAHAFYGLMPQGLVDAGRRFMDDRRLLTRLDLAARKGYDKRIKGLAK
ncbi:MAG TPA: SDR family oxidoreductase [Fluviicoccus sp.]|nr:SDR family oxidoreductase [Fluviicoccus sp.]